MALTKVGPHDFPSAAYATFDVRSGVGPVHVAAAGAGPSDGFTGYVAYVGSPTPPLG